MANILVADDEAEVRQLVRYALEKGGHQVFETTTGTDAAAFLKSNPVDLLVLDVMLPGMDGYTLQMQLAQDPKTRDIPVVVITASQPAKGMFAKFPQVREALLKPFDPTELSSKVDKILAATKKVKNG